MAIITYPLNGIQYGGEDAETYLCSRSSGVFSAEDSFPITITANMQVSIGTGLAWIKNNTFKGKSVCSNAATAITIPTAHSTLPRIDRIVLEFTTAQNGCTIKLVQGTPAANPSPPAIVQTASQYQLGLYTVRVNAAASSISASNISDTRANESVCGVMRDSVERIPTQTLLNSMLSEFNEFMDTIQTTLTGDVAGNLMTLINTKITAPTQTNSLPASNTALTENTIYNHQNSVNTYVFKPPADGKWAHGTFTTGSSPNISFASGAQFCDDIPAFLPNTKYEFDVLGGIWIVKEVLS